jgi:prepilin-type N-terminal cleavage/methylation domain-containing protein/prepilin-type processing-associated H-X9-DG protein
MVMKAKKSNGFTLIELLVVIAVIAILMAILMPALNKARNQARRVTCANNVKQLSTSLNIYANDYDGKLPLNKAGYWYWDIAYSTTDYMIKAGATRDTFYCPCDTTKNADMAILWQFTNSPPPPYGARPEAVVEPKTNRDNYYRVTGYFWLMDTQAGRTTKPNGVPDNWKWPRTVTGKYAASTELICDATLSTGRDADTASFVDVQGGLWSQWQLLDRTNHVTGGNRPDGANVAFVDGHQERRPFTDMIDRIPNFNPVHWW